MIFGDKSVMKIIGYMSTHICSLIITVESRSCAIAQQERCKNDNVKFQFYVKKFYVKKILFIYIFFIITSGVYILLYIYILIFSFCFTVVETIVWTLCNGFSVGPDLRLLVPLIFF